MIILKSIKPFAMLLLVALLFSFTISSCGNKKTDKVEQTEEHPAAEEEHPSGGDEHPSGDDEHPTKE
ncbi:hypothetical protein [uncultured Cyclobacterium sp.]|uniref:hypothetical protein n=1 Tax=uncultured Cyclobacterium sp. TaxID=453820 RepID=UPI0030EB8754|tara:strand:+ start:260 stop:460 length:201 start_codon:yes stop_codon:yes gene_type:complete